MTSNHAARRRLSLLRGRFLPWSGAVLAALLSSCAEIPQQPGASFALGAAAVVQAPAQPVDWGYLGQYIDAVYLNDNGDSLVVKDAGNGSLLIRIRSPQNLVYMKVPVMQMEVRPAPRDPGAYYLKILDSGVFADDGGLVRFAGDGRMQIIAGDFGALKELSIGNQAEYLHGNFRSPPMRRDVYRFNDGREVPVAYSPGSSFQQVRMQTPPFGLWENHVGQVYAGSASLLKVEKTEAGALRLSRLTPDERLFGNYTFTRPAGSSGTQLRLVDTSYLRSSDVDVDWATLSENEMLSVRFRKDAFGHTSRGSYSAEFLPRGDHIVAYGQIRYPGTDDMTTWKEVYRPLTAERLQAATLEYQRRLARDERDRIYAERQAAERAAESQATANAIMAGLSRGFAQAQQSNARMAQQSLDFERNLNQKLQIQQQQQQQRQQREREAAAQRVERLMAANAAARKPAAPATGPASSITSPAAAAGTATTTAAAAATASSGASPASSASQASCRAVDDGVLKWSEFGRSREEAERKVRSTAGAGTCQHRGGVVGLSVGACTERKNTRTEVDTSVPGKLGFNRVETGSTWQCEATYRCAQPKQVCDAAPARATRQ